MLNYINMSDDRPTVLVTNPHLYEGAIDLLSKKCNVIVCKEGENTKEDITKNAKNVAGILWFSLSQMLDQLVVDAAGPTLKVVSTLSAGYDNVDTELLKSRGIKLGNASFALKDCVAEVAISLTLTAAHRLQEGYKKMVNGEWKIRKPFLFGQEVRDSTVGIVGLGHIGTEIAIRLKAFKIKELLYTGHSEKPQAKELEANFVSLDKLLEKSDFVFIACPLNESTRHLFGKTQFDKMKRNAIIINIARGDIINQDDLVDALRNRTIYGAALDVFTPEPLPSDHPLTKLENCVLSPHIASATYKTRQAMDILGAENVLSALEGRPMPSPVF